MTKALKEGKYRKNDSHIGATTPHHILRYFINLSFASIIPSSKISDKWSANLLIVFICNLLCTQIVVGVRDFHI